MDSNETAEFSFGPIERIVMQHATRRIIFKIAPGKCQHQLVANRTDDGSGPDFDIQFDDLSQRDLLNFVMTVIGPVGLCAFRVELAVRRP